MTPERMKIGKMPKASAMKPATIGPIVLTMLPGRKERAYPLPLFSLGESLAVIADNAGMPSMPKNRYIR